MCQHIYHEEIIIGPYLKGKSPFPLLQPHLQWTFPPPPQPQRTLPPPPPYSSCSLLRATLHFLNPLVIIFSGLFHPTESQFRYRFIHNGIIISLFFFCFQKRVTKLWFLCRFLYNIVAIPLLFFFGFWRPLCVLARHITESWFRGGFNVFYFIFVIIFINSLTFLLLFYKLMFFIFVIIFINILMVFTFCYQKKVFRPINGQ